MPLRPLLVIVELIAILFFTLAVLEIERIISSKGDNTAMLVIAILSSMAGIACFVGALFLRRKLKSSI
ncbi:MAG TPA: hypothetical protein VF043_18925 [Ktedonobacteraceae bacterium]